MILDHAVWENPMIGALSIHTKYLGFSNEIFETFNFIRIILFNLS